MASQRRRKRACSPRGAWSALASLRPGSLQITAVREDNGELITATAAKALRTPGLPPHIRTAALVLGAAGWMQVSEAHIVRLKLDLGDLNCKFFKIIFAIPFSYVS